MEAQSWLNLQSHYDMEVALEALEDRLGKEVHPFSHSAQNIPLPNNRIGQSRGFGG